MAPPASTFLTAGFVAFPLLLCAALVLGSDWAGRRLGESTRARVHWAIGVGAGAAAWLAVTGWLAAGGILRDWDRLPPPFVWLPAVMVTAALIGHLLVFRWVASTAGA